MARPGINYLDVAQAATKLMEQDIRPSIEAIRQSLGTGSNSTINRHLRVWRDKQGNQIELEQGLPESLLISVKGIYEAIKEDANHKIAANTTQTETAVNELNNQLSQIKIQHDQLFRDKCTLEKANQQQQAEHSALQRIFDEAKNTLNKKTAENSLLTQRINDKNAEVGRLGQQLNHVQNNLEHYRETVRQDRETETRRFESTINHLEHDTQQKQKIISQLSDETSTQQRQLSVIEHDQQTKLKALEQLQNDDRQQSATIQAQQLEFANLQQKHQQLQDAHEQQQQKVQNEQATILEITRKSDKMEGQLQEINRALKKAEDTVTTLSHNNQFLEQEKKELVSQVQQLQSAIP